MSLAVENLDKEYPTRSGPLSVLRRANLELQRGESLAIMGPSGSGKSTLLHILGTLDQPTRGKVTIEGVDPFQLSEPKLAAFRNRRIGMIFQDHHLLPQCTVMENVLLPTLVAKEGDNRTIAQAAESLLERVGLSKRMTHYPSELSGGERQRVAVARALIQKPILLLADEPTGNLDRVNSQAVGRLLLDLHREDNTVLIVVTHNPELAGLLPRQMEVVDGALSESSR
jgi:lipoprotein-releasing system ATP-binding protein